MIFRIDDDAFVCSLGAGAPSLTLLRESLRHIEAEVDLCNEAKPMEFQPGASCGAPGGISASMASPRTRTA